jgi:hypothetical protein
MFSKIFPTNEHKVERVLRVLLGVGILSLFFVGPQSPWALLGAVPLLTGLIGSCPIYTLFGMSTCPVKSNEKDQSTRAESNASA